MTLLPVFTEPDGCFATFRGSHCLRLTSCRRHYRESGQLAILDSFEDLFTAQMREEDDSFQIQVPDREIELGEITF